MTYSMFSRGWDQLEVTCNPNTKDPKTFWNVEVVHDGRCELIV